MILEDIIKAETEKTFLPLFDYPEDAINYINSKENSLELSEYIILLSNLGKMFPNSLEVSQYLSNKTNSILG